MENIRAMFLKQSMRDCEETFGDAVLRKDAAAWDWLVVTAANEAQAEAYRAQIDMRQQMGLLPEQTRYAVIADPDGKRVGSGGATLNVLREIARAEGGDTPFALRKILVLHSGGDSRRIPQYSACGKLFAHVPRALPDGRPSTLFDEFCIALSCVPSRMTGGMLVMSGDVLLLFNALQIDLERVGAACLSIKAPVSVGRNHGVFLPDDEGGVRAFLHKQSEETLRSVGAVNRQGMVDIDTGAIWLDEARVDALYGLIRQDDKAFDAFVNEQVRLSFYGDMVYPMVGSATLAEYIEQPPENVMSDALIEARRAIFEAIGGTGIALIRLSPAEFFHFGTSEEWRALMMSAGERFGFLGWRRAVLSEGAGDDIASVSSVVEPGAQVGAGTALEDSRLLRGACVGVDAIISGADFSGTLPDASVLHVLPIDDGSAYCCRYYGTRDNPKEAKRFGKPIDGALWDAPLHPVRKTADEAISAALSFDMSGECLSLAESFGRASMRDILTRQQALGDEVRALRVVSRLRDGCPVQEVLPLLSEGASGTRQRERLIAHAEQAAFPLKGRIYYLLSHAFSDASLASRCWKSINDHLLSHASVSVEAGSIAFATDRAEVSLPVRLNWGGGWSDTPPYCLEHGGTVLNAAVLLGGKRPVYALAERTPDHAITIESDDLGFAKTYHTMESLATGNPSDPHALCKAALCVCGVIPQDGMGPLAPMLAKMGGGIRLRTAVRGVPKGSGLGTSSILSAAVARALSRLIGQPDGDAHIASQTLLMEQIMNTGGGWQDQIGGLLPGIKLTSSHPGTPQKLSWRHIHMSDEAFEALQRRYALVFTGQRRLARNILRDIMGKAVARIPDTMAVLSQIQRLAVLMAFELETGDIDEFARLLSEHWVLSRRLDAGSSNTCIDHMVAVCDDLIDGAMIAGAGGGGFMGFLMKDGVTHKQLSQRLEDVFQDSGVKVWDAQIDRG